MNKSPSKRKPVRADSTAQGNPSQLRATFRAMRSAAQEARQTFAKMELPASQ